MKDNESERKGIVQALMLKYSRSVQAVVLKRIYDTASGGVCAQLRVRPIVNDI